MKSCDVYIGSLLIFKNVRIADTFFGRFKGLMGKKKLNGFDGLYITPCNQIHTFFMKMDIDAVFLDNNMKTVKIYDSVDRGCVMPKVRVARSVLELPAGTAARYGICEGDILSFVLKKGVKYEN